MTANLKLHTKEAAPNQFECYWTTGRKQGIVTITLANPDLQDGAIVAELSALHHLLSHKAVLGADRAGNGISIDVTFGAIRRLVQNASNKKHLFPYARFLLIRYAEARISVDKNADWIVPARAEARREALTIDAPLQETIEVSGIGRVGLSYHILDRMMQRANYASITAAWRHLCQMLCNGGLKQVALPKNIADHKEIKHGTIGKHLRAAGSPWQFVVASREASCGAIPTLVTVYVRP